MRASRLIVTLLAALTTTVVMAAAAHADTVPLASAVRGVNGFYSWCNQSTLASILPDTVSPQTPTGCGLWSAAGTTGQVTATFGAHGAGRLNVSVYTSDGTRPFSLQLHVNGATVQTQSAQQNHQGWMSFSPITVSASGAVSVYASADRPGSNYAQIYDIHGDLAPWSSPAWSMVGTPGNWATTPIPGDVVTDPGTSPVNGAPLSTQVPRELAGHAAADPYVNMNSYTEGTYVPLSTPLQPVRLCRSSGSCVPNWGAATDDLWRMAMGLGNSAVPNWTTGQCARNRTYIGGGLP